MISRNLDNKRWLVDELTPSNFHYQEIREVLFHQQTDFQEIWIIDCGFYGKALILDDYLQSATRDEFLYHEPLIHPALIAHGNAQRVLVLGGGEGAAVREILKWHSVTEVTMVDIDRAVVAACREHLPEMHQGAFDNPRTNLVITDALNYLDDSEKAWDIIISDLADPVEDGPSYKLFTQEYFEKCLRALTPEGYLVVQAGACDLASLDMHVQLVHTVQSVFPHVVTYSSYVASYGSIWGFILASTQPINTRPEPQVVDQMLAEKTTGNLRMFDGTTLLGLLQIPKHMRAAIEAETKVFTLIDPPGLPNTK